MNFINLFISLLIMCFFIYLWGKLKQKMAYDRMRKGIACLDKNDPLSAIKHFETIGNELKYDADYWYYLSVALYKAGALSDSIEAVHKALELECNNKYAQNFLQFINSRH